MIGRIEEKRQLLDHVAREEAQLIVVYGRRRVGKTYLIRETFNNNFTFSYTGIENVDKTRQLLEFNKALRRAGQETDRLPEDWFEAFDLLRLLIESHGDARKTVFIDELPWMDNRGSDFMAALEHFWNGWASGIHKLTLIVCGSATSWISKKIFHNRGGLYNRASLRMYLAPFALAECEAFFEDKGIRMNRYDMVGSYMVFGGIPYYLDNFDGRYSLAQNIDRLCFGDNALLRDEYDEVFESLFTRSEKHAEVVGALSFRKKGLSREEIKARISFPDGGNLTRILRELELCGFIREYSPFGRKRKGALYQLSDSFTLFYLTWMKGRQQGSEGFWSSMLGSGAYNAWSGYAFEQVCLAHIPQIKKALGIAGVLTSCSAWSSSAPEEKGVQIDLVIERADNIINLCEMKYRNDEYLVSKDEDLGFRNKRGTFVRETRTRKAVHLTLVTTYGLKQAKYSSVFQSEVRMDDLFA
jgi:AAA+ ATPase superfamily predicted ATPase